MADPRRFLLLCMQAQGASAGLIRLTDANLHLYSSALRHDQRRFQCQFL
jgi:hypothetical protein